MCKVSVSICVMMLLKIAKSLTISPKLCLLSVLTDGVNIQLTCIS